MKRTVRSVFVLFLTLILLMSTMSATVWADNGTDEKGWNIMLVVDGSGSLFSTDANKLRYEAISQFLDVISSNGYNVGAIVFSANMTARDTQEAMLRGIMADTGIMPLDGTAPNGMDAKRYIYNSIVSAGVNKSRGGSTDIGTALLLAQQRLSALDNGNNSAIFLFTDGETDLDYSNTLEQSYINLQQATTNIYQQGIKLCGVFLNKDGKSRSNEVRDIVSRASGLNDGAVNLGDRYVEITDAASCTSSIKSFLSMLGFSIVDGPEKVFSGSYDEQFIIPGIGVEEANIILESESGEKIPTEMAVTITSPDGTVYAGASASAICMRSDTYELYKLSNPVSGLWNVHVELPEGNKIKIKYSPVFSISVDAELTVEPVKEELHANSTATVTVYLTKDGAEVENINAYNEYSCKLSMTNVYTGENKTIEIAQNENGKFTHEVELDYGTYDVQASFICDEVDASTDVETWVMENHAPEGWSGNSEFLKCGLLQPKTTVIDLSAYAYDVEDGRDLNYTITKNECDEAAVELDGNQLTLDNNKVGEGKIYLLITDSQGASMETYVAVYTENVTFKVLMVLIAILLVIFALAIILLRARPRLDGDLTLRYETDDKEDELYLLLPGNGYGKRTARLLNLVDERDKNECSDVIGDLGKKVKISAVSGKEGRKKVGKIKVTYGGKSQGVLYRSHTMITNGNCTITLSYIPNLDDDDDDGWDDTTSTKSSSSGWDDDDY